MDSAGGQSLRRSTIDRLSTGTVEGYGVGRTRGTNRVLTTRLHRSDSRKVDRDSATSRVGQEHVVILCQRGSRSHRPNGERRVVET